MRTPLRDHLVTMLVTLGLVTGGGAALAAVGAATTPEITGCETVSTTPEPLDTAVSETSDEGDLPAESDVPEGDVPEGDVPDCEDEVVDEGTDEGDDADPVETDGGAVEEEEPAEDTDVGVDADREATCHTAAGLERGPRRTARGDDAGSTNGIEHAMERVLANCVKNPDAPGLLNALEHLATNAARKAARDAAKEAGRHGHGEGHGPDAAPGRSGEAPGHSGDAPGHSGDAPGHSGEHGNPHV